MMFEYHVSICLLIDLSICKGFFKNLYKYFSRSLEERCIACCSLVKVYLKSPNIFRDFCQPFHNLINNNLLVNENVGANRPNQIYIFLQSDINIYCKLVYFFILINQYTFLYWYKKVNWIHLFYQKDSKFYDYCVLQHLLLSSSKE